MIVSKMSTFSCIFFFKLQVFQIGEVMMKYDMLVGVWWAKKDFEKKFKRKLLDIYHLEFDDGSLKEGGIADPMHGNPPGWHSDDYQRVE